MFVWDDWSMCLVVCWEGVLVSVLGVVVEVGGCVFGG